MNTTLQDLFHNAKVEVIAGKTYYNCRIALESMGAISSIADYRAKVRYHCKDSWYAKIGTDYYLTIEGVFALVATSRVMKVRELYQEYLSHAIKAFEIDVQKLTKKVNVKVTPTQVAESLGIEIPDELTKSLNNFVRRLCSEFHLGSDLYLPKNPSVTNAVFNWCKRQGLTN